VFEGCCARSEEGGGAREVVQEMLCKPLCLRCL
jgi:hypothetical protein